MLGKPEQGDGSGVRACSSPTTVAASVIVVEGCRYSRSFLMLRAFELEIRINT